MPTEPDTQPPTRKKIPRTRFVNDGFVVYELDFSVPNDPTQPKFPVVIQPPSQPQPRPTSQVTSPPEAEEALDPIYPPTAPGTPPPPGG